MSAAQSDLSTLLNPALIPELRRIELRTRRVVSTDLIGHYRSAFRGSGLVFSELREYQPGDDVRHINWRATARTGRVYVKSFEEERHLNIILALDISASTAFGPARSRQERAREFAALLAVLASRSGDSLGLALFSDKIDLLLPPASRRFQLYRVLYELLNEHGFQDRTDLAASLQALHGKLRRRSVIFLISDFLSPDFESELLTLAFRHDVILVLPEDPAEHQLPAAGLVRLRDPESGEIVLVDSSSPALRAELQSAYTKRLRELQELCDRADCDLLRVQTSPLAPLAELMRKRSARMR
ncbi:MAG: DUF58 domain-containing protein [Oligoflexia bacterium]|nr:DUF58 domain-containing protein [Oligoflexia bacterium]